MEKRIEKNYEGNGVSITVNSGRLKIVNKVCELVENIFNPEEIEKEPQKEEVDMVEVIARTCHEVNKTYCESLGDDSQVNWDEAPDWQKESVINGVKFHLGNPRATPSDSHENWMKEKLEAGWKYGEIKDVDKKEHPCLVPYEELPKEQQVKDALFISVVRSF